MTSLITTPLKASELIAPIMRPLPTIFTYARLTSEPKGGDSSVLRDEFRASVAALTTIIETACREGEIPDEASQPVLDCCGELLGKRGSELASRLDALCAALTTLHGEHRKALKRAVDSDPDRYRDLYRQMTRPKKVMVIYCEKGVGQADRLERTLSDRCYYDYEAVGEDWVSARPRTADVVVFGPCQQAIQPNVMSMVEASEVPILILIATDAKSDRENMAMLKVEHLYRKNGYKVLRGPFAPARLYQAIDSLYLQHLGDKVVEIPEVRREAGADLEAEGGRL